jgi:hypothetical protein
MNGMAALVPRVSLCYVILDHALENCGSQMKGKQPMPDYNTIQDLNEQLARKIHEEAQRDPHSPYAYKYVGIANGRDVVAADDLDELDRLLEEIEPDPEKRYCARIDPDKEFNEDNTIWGLH